MFHAEPVRAEQEVRLTHVTDAERVGDPAERRRACRLDRHAAVRVLAGRLHRVQHRGRSVVFTSVSPGSNFGWPGNDAVNAWSTRLLNAAARSCPTGACRVELRVQRTEHPVVALVDLEVAGRRLGGPVRLLDDAAQPLAQRLALVLQDDARLRPVGAGEVVGHALPALTRAAQQPVEDRRADPVRASLGREEVRQPHHRTVTSPRCAGRRRAGRPRARCGPARRTGSR